MFDLIDVVKQYTEFHTGIKDNLSAFNAELLQWITEVENKITALQTVAEKFKLQLNKFFINDALTETGMQLQQRLTAASGYFIQEIDAVIACMKQSPAVTDSKQHAKTYNDQLKEVFVLLAEKKHLLHCCLENFTTDNYYRQKKSFIVPAFGVNAYATASEKKTESLHPLLHKKLRELRNKICEQKNVPVYYVAGSTTIDEMAAYLPQNLDELIKISGFGQAKAKQYGRAFLEVILEYCKERDLSSSIHTKQQKKERKEKTTTEEKEDTKTITYKLHKEGNSITDIAGLRNLAASTIESHLAYYIRRGIISVNELVKTEKLILIEPCLESFEGGSITSIKEKLGDAVSFGEIRMVLAAKEWEKMQHES